MKFIVLALLVLISPKITTALKNLKDLSLQPEKIDKKTLPPPLEIKSYNSLLMAVSWTSLSSQKEKSQTFEPNTYTIHGLWPVNYTSTKSDPCNDHMEIQVNLDDEPDLKKKMIKYWATSRKNSTNEKFWTHEYNKNGYCYTRKEFKSSEPKKYFKDAISFFEKKKYYKLIQNIFGAPTNEPKKITVIEIKAIIKEKLGQDEKIVLRCVEFKKKKYVELTGIYFYYEPDFTPLKAEPFQEGICTKDETVITIWYKL